MGDVKKKSYLNPKPMTPDAAVKWLEKASKYFKQRDTGGEDMAYWANIANGEACEKIIDLIKSMEENRG